MSDHINELFDRVVALRDTDPAQSRTAKLFRDGVAKMAKKVAEEGVEVALEAVQGNREALVLESADLIYNLVVVWVQAGVHPDDVWAEMERRVQMMGIAEKLPKSGAAFVDGAVQKRA